MMARKRSSIDGHETRCRACDAARAFFGYTPKGGRRRGQHFEKSTDEKARARRDRRAARQRARRAAEPERYRTRLLRIAAQRWADEDLYVCVYCGADFAHTDHVVPKSKGGPGHPQNLVPACLMCNSVKTDTDVLTFIASTLGPDVVARVLSWPVRWVEID